MSTATMRKIEMVDLKAQYRQIKPEIDRAVQGVVDSLDITFLRFSVSAVVWLTTSAMAFFTMKYASHCSDPIHPVKSCKGILAAESLQK
jgi:hypothetical protein